MYFCFQPSVELLFLDYGNVETTSAGSIRWLSPETAKVPVQAVNCSLCGILPLEVRFYASAVLAHLGQRIMDKL